MCHNVGVMIIHHSATLYNLLHFNKCIYDGAFLKVCHLFLFQAKQVIMFLMVIVIQKLIF